MLVYVGHVAGLQLLHSLVVDRLHFGSCWDEFNTIQVIW
jgi:hypothetical protein